MQFVLQKKTRSHGALKSIVYIETLSSLRTCCKEENPFIPWPCPSAPAHPCPADLRPPTAAQGGREGVGGGSTLNHRKCAHLIPEVVLSSLLSLRLISSAGVPFRVPSTGFPNVDVSCMYRVCMLMFGYLCAVMLMAGCCCTFLFGNSVKSFWICWKFRWRSVMRSKMYTYRWIISKCNFWFRSFFVWLIFQLNIIRVVVGFNLVFDNE